MIEINATLIAQIINFLILVALFKAFAYKPLMKALEERRIRIAENIEAAEKNKLAAEELRKEYQANLAEARIQAQAIVEKATKQAEVNAEEILEQAKVESARILKAAQEEIVREQERALESMRKEVVSLSVLAAGKIIATNMDAEANDKLVNDFIEKLDDKKMGGLPC